jgi:homoserine kinase type II
MRITDDTPQILGHYDLGTLQSITPFGGGATNELALAQTDTGRFVVRRNHWRYTEEQHRYRHWLLGVLCENDVPTHAPVPSRSGDTLVRVDRRFCEVLPFIEGDTYAPQRPQQLDSIGATLAHYHRVVHGLPEPPAAPHLRYAPQNILALYEQLLARDVLGDLTDILNWYAERAAHLRSILSDGPYTVLPHLVIHGDIHQGNLLFHQDRVVGLLDFDQVGWDIPLTDLADALIAFASTSENQTIHWGVFRGPLDEERAARLVGHYVAGIPRDASYLEFLPTLLETLWLQGELGRVISTPEGAPEYHQEVLGQGYHLSEWLNQRHDHLVARWQQATPLPARAA